LRISGYSKVIWKTTPQAFTPPFSRNFDRRNGKKLLIIIIFLKRDLDTLGCLLLRGFICEFFTMETGCYSEKGVTSL
jgi:hypothetical protein